jgi:hypothetical protein
MPPYDSNSRILVVQVDAAVPEGITLYNTVSIDGDDVDPTTVTIPTEVCREGIPVYFDILPDTCPNDFNVKAKGRLPTAILGTDDFDVMDIDISTVMLTDGVMTVAPEKWSYADVSTPFMGDPCDCHMPGADGWTDLTLKFRRPEVTSTFGLEGRKGEDVLLTITGNLVGGESFSGDDCIYVLITGPNDGMLPDDLEFVPTEGETSPYEDQIGLSFYTRTEGHITLEIFDVHGRMIRTLIDGHLSSGTHTVAWDGRGYSGSRVPTGVYFARVRNVTQSATKKVLIVN